jgi:hypothetical protein
MIIKEITTFTRDALGFPTYKDVEVKWVCEDNSFHSTTKTWRKYYSLLEKIQEGKIRRGNLFDKKEEQQTRLIDPNSEESKRKREVYKRLGFQVPNNFSATDLNDPTVLQTLKGQMEQSRLAAMPRGGIGVGGAGRTKEEKESKDQKETDKFTSNTENNIYLNKY